jgi:hypothetical protein
VRHPPPSPGCAEFTIIMECTPENDRCHSVSILSSVVYNMEKEHGKEIHAHIPFVDVDSKSPSSVYSHRQALPATKRERKDCGRGKEGGPPWL